MPTGDLQQQNVDTFEEAAVEKISAKWESLSESSMVLRFLDINLRSIGQVMFQNNPLTGLLFLAAIS